MDSEAIEVCVCIPPRIDNRPAQEQAETLERFRALDPRIRFTFADYIDKPEMRILRGQPGFEQAREQATPASPELRQAFLKANVILCVDLPFDMDTLAPNLRWVQSAGAGVAQLQTCGLDKLNCLLTSGAGIMADPISEFVLARILSHWKLFSVLEQNQRHHRWQQAYGRELAGCTLGIVGYGAIGRATARRAKAFGMKVLATRKHLQPGATDPDVDQFYPSTELKAMLARCDAVVLSAAESPETYHLFNADTFAAMPAGSYFCNVSRGSLVDEKALIAALASGHLAGASIDVAANEPLPADDPLWDAPNLAISPHCSPTLENFYRNAWRLFYENMRRFLAGEMLINLCSTRYG